MKKLLLILLLISISCTVWGEERFEITYHQLNKPTNIYDVERIKVIRDTLTGEEYLFYKQGVGREWQKLEKKLEENNVYCDHSEKGIHNFMCSSVVSDK